MDDTLSLRLMTEEQNRRIVETVEREQRRLRNFIRKHVLDESDVEDILLRSSMNSCKPIA